MRSITNFAAIIASAALLAACSTPVPLTDNVKVEDRQADKVLPTLPDDKNTVKPVILEQQKEGQLQQGLLAKRSVYFDLDSYIVKDEFKPVIEAHGKNLSVNKAQKVIIQGNTDERGGREYNLALGQKRAESVRKSLSLLGVPESQMESVSFGKEKPKATGSNEAAWAENRRADIVYR